MCYFNPGGTVGSCIGKTELPGADDSFDQVPSTTEENFITSTSIPANSKNNTPTNPQDNTPKPTVSTEDLTKELDAFVDDITKGL